MSCFHVTSSSQGCPRGCCLRSKQRRLFRYFDNTVVVLYPLQVIPPSRNIIEAMLGVRPYRSFVIQMPSRSAKLQFLFVSEVEISS